MSQTRQPYRELAESTLKDDKDINEIETWLEENIGKKSDVQTDLQAYIRDMAAARKTRQETKKAQDSELAEIHADHSRQMMELLGAESEIIKTHPTVEKIKLGVDEIIQALFKTQKEVEQLDQIQQRLYGDEGVDRILKKPQDNMTDRVSGLIQAEKERLQKICSGFHGKLCYFWSLVSPKVDSIPFERPTHTETSPCWTIPKNQLRVETPLTISYRPHPSSGTTPTNSFPAKTSVRRCQHVLKDCSRSHLSHQTGQRPRIRRFYASPARSSRSEETVSTEHQLARDV